MCACTAEALFATLESKLNTTEMSREEAATATTKKKHEKLRSFVHCDITLACDSHIERQQRHR